jgi:hypothetical protein
VKGFFEIDLFRRERFETIHLLIDLLRRLDFEKTFHILTRNKMAPGLSPPLAGGDEGEGDKQIHFHPHPFPPPSRGRGFWERYNKMANTRVGGIGHLKSVNYLLSEHGRYGRFQPCPNGLLPYPVQSGLRKKARRFKLIY